MWGSYVSSQHTPRAFGSFVHLPMSRSSGALRLCVLGQTHRQSSSVGCSGRISSACGVPGRSLLFFHPRLERRVCDDLFRLFSSRRSGSEEGGHGGADQHALGVMRVSRTRDKCMSRETVTSRFRVGNGASSRLYRNPHPKGHIACCPPLVNMSSSEVNKGAHLIP